MGDVADAEGDRISVDARIGQRQALSVAHHPVDLAEPAGIEGAIAPHLDHRQIIVDDGDACLSIEAGEQAHRHVARASGDVHEVYARARHQPVEHRLFPKAVDACAHEVVHEIITGGDPLEDGLDATGLLFRRDLLKAEGGGEPRRGACRIFGAHADRARSLATVVPYAAAAGPARLRAHGCQSSPKSRRSAADWRYV